MQNLSLEESKIVDGVMFIQGSDAKTLIIPNYDNKKNIVGGMLEQSNEERTTKIFFSKDYYLIPELTNKFSQYNLEEERRNFVQECLLKTGIGNGLPTIEIKASLEDSMTKRLFKRGQASDVVLVNSHLSYFESEKIGFNKVISGEILTGNKHIWTVDHRLRDKSGVGHPDLTWAQEVKENLIFDKSSLLCLSRRKDIRRLVGHFKEAYIGYYGLIGSKSLEWSKEFYQRELENNLNEFEIFEEEKELSDNSKVLVHLYIRK